MIIMIIILAIIIISIMIIIKIKEKSYKSSENHINKLPINRKSEVMSNGDGKFEKFGYSGKTSKIRKNVIQNKRDI